MLKNKEGDYVEIVEKSIDEIKPYEKNPRKNDEAVKYVMESIKQFGFKVPIVIDKDNVIVCGHTRYKASKKLGIEVVPCVIADDLTEEQIKAFRLADNKVSEKAEWDFDLLNEEIDDILNIDMQEFGFFDEEEKSVLDVEDRKDLSGEVTETFEVVVECINELDQQEVYEKLKGDGYTCRVLTL